MEYPALARGKCLIIFIYHAGAKTEQKCQYSNSTSCPAGEYCCCCVNDYVINVCFCSTDECQQSGCCNIDCDECYGRQMFISQRGWRLEPLANIKPGEYRRAERNPDSSDRYWASCTSWCTKLGQVAHHMHRTRGSCTLHSNHICLNLDLSLVCDLIKMISFVF